MKLYVEPPRAPASTVDARPVRVAVAVGDGPPLPATAYGWDPWHKVAWHERHKAGFDGLADAMRSLSAD